MRFLRTLAFVAIVAVIAGVAIGFWRSSGPSLADEGCTANVAGTEVYIDLAQAENASLIAAIGVERGLPARAVSIALATAFQESKLYNLRGGDRDSLGIFQQRPSQGWGTPKQIMTPTYSINAFYDALVKVPGYETMRITDAAQRVQRSGFPQAYEPHAADARALASALTGFSAGGRFSCVVQPSAKAHGTAAAVIRTLTTGYGSRVMATSGGRQDVVVSVPGGPGGLRLGWSMAQYLVAHAKSRAIQSVSFDGKVWRAGDASAKRWTNTSAPATRILVSLG